MRLLRPATWMGRLAKPQGVCDSTADNLSRAFLEELEAHFDIQLDQNRSAVFHGWPEPVLLDSCDGPLVEALADSANRTHMGRVALLIDPQADQHGAADLVLLCLFGILRDHRVGHHWRRDSAADPPGHDAGA